MITKLPDGIEDKDVIKEIAGKLTAVYDSETKQGQYGEYTTQNCKIQIDGKEYKLSLMNHAIPKAAKGKIIVLKSQKGDKGYSGVSYAVETYTGKNGANKGKTITAQVIKANANAILEYPDGSSAEASASSSPAKAPDNSQPKSNRRLEQVTEIDLPESYGQLIDGILRLHAECDGLVRQCYKDDNLPEDTIRAYVSTVFIEANHRGSDAFLKFRKGDAPKTAEKPEGDDAPWIAEPEEQPTQETQEDEKDDVPDEGEAENPYAKWEEVKVPSGPKEGKTLGECGSVYIQKLLDHYKGKFDTEFKKFVEQAGKDLGIIKSEDDDEIPM